VGVEEKNRKEITVRRGGDRTCKCFQCHEPCDQVLWGLARGPTNTHVASASKKKEEEGLPSGGLTVDKRGHSNSQSLALIEASRGLDWVQGSGR